MPTDRKAVQAAYGTLADRTPDVLRLIRDSIENRGCPPTRREITDLLGRSSASAAQRLIERLEADGLIKRVERGRGLVITESGMKAITEAV